MKQTKNNKKLLEKEISFLPEYLHWTSKLKVGDEFLVMDNSYCFKEVSKGNFEKTTIHPGAHISSEDGYGLIITKIYLKNWSCQWTSKSSLYPTVELKSKKTGSNYIVGICWGEDAYKIQVYPKKQN